MGTYVCMYVCMYVTAGPNIVTGKYERYLTVLIGKYKTYRTSGQSSNRYI